MDDIVFEELAQEPEEKEVKPKRKLVEVHPFNYLAHRRKQFVVIVNKDETEAWLLPAAEVKNDEPFKLSETELEQLPKPYDFQNELAELMPTHEDLQYAFWLAGVWSKDDLRNVGDVKRALAMVFPTANKFVQYFKEK